MNARTLARALGGDVVGHFQVVAPGPGHSPKDRSLAVFIDWQAPDGFRVHSHAVPRDDWQACRLLDATHAIGVSKRFDARCFPFVALRRDLLQNAAKAA